MSPHKKKVSRKRARNDRDLTALFHAARALEKSSCGRMLRANLEFLWDHFIAHPNKETLAKFYGQNFGAPEDLRLRA